MAALIEAIEIKRKMFFEFENAPYHCLDVEVSKPTARGGQTLVRLKMRNLLTRAVFDKRSRRARNSATDLKPSTRRISGWRQRCYHFMDQGAGRCPEARDVARTASLVGRRRADPENGQSIACSFTSS
jgi:elongation factor P